MNASEVVSLASNLSRIFSTATVAEVCELLMDRNVDGLPGRLRSIVLILAAERLVELANTPS